MENKEKDLLEGRRMLISALMEAEAKSVVQKVSEMGVFPPVFWAMKYYGTEYKGRLYTQYSQEHGCCIRASILADGKNREISNYVFFGTKTECTAWLENPEHVEVLIEIYDHLIRRADDM